MMGETVVVLHRAKKGEDSMGDPVWEWEPTVVENVLVRPLSSADVSAGGDALRPERAMSGYSLAFPKTYAGKPLRGARVALVARGMDGAGEHTQKEVADSLGISQSYISRLEKRIIEKIKKEV